MNISVVMATYNGARFVDAQIRSILLQLETRDERVIVDDASTDDTPVRLAAIADTRRVAAQESAQPRRARNLRKPALQLALDTFLERRGVAKTSSVI